MSEHDSGKQDFMTLADLGVDRSAAELKTYVGQTLYIQEIARISVADDGAPIDTYYTVTFRLPLPDGGTSVDMQLKVTSKRLLPLFNRIVGPKLTHRVFLPALRVRVVRSGRSYTIA